MLKYKGVLVLFLVVLGINCNANAESATISTSDIVGYIESQKPLVAANGRIDLVAPFIQKSSIPAKRFGNTKNVLNLQGLSFKGLDLSNVSMNMANMQSTNLQNANFKNADLVHVDLSGADLSGANFEGADLSNAHFEGTKIEGTNFQGANLFNAAFEKMANIDPEILKALQARTKAYIEFNRLKPKGQYD